MFSPKLALSWISSVVHEIVLAPALAAELHPCSREGPRPAPYRSLEDRVDEQYQNPHEKNELIDAEKMVNPSPRTQFLSSLEPTLLILIRALACLHKNDSLSAVMC